VFELIIVFIIFRFSAAACIYVSLIPLKGNEDELYMVSQWNKSCIYTSAVERRKSFEQFSKESYRAVERK
jgi:hypothetical protein